MAKITFTPKDCLYIEDIINTSLILYKKTLLESEQLQDDALKEETQIILDRLQSQSQCLLELLEGAQS